MKNKISFYIAMKIVTWAQKNKKKVQDLNIKDLAKAFKYKP